MICRYLRRLKRKITNKYRVEGSISQGYLIEEAAKFASYYFAGGDPFIPRRMRRNETDNVENYDENVLSIFRQHGQSIGKTTKRWLTNQEYVAARKYVLLNSLEAEPFIE